MHYGSPGEPPPRTAGFPTHQVSSPHTRSVSVHVHHVKSRCVPWSRFSLVSLTLTLGQLLSHIKFAKRKSVAPKSDHNYPSRTTSHTHMHTHTTRQLLQNHFVPRPPQYQVNFRDGESLPQIPPPTALVPVLQVELAHHQSNSTDSGTNRSSGEHGRKHRYRDSLEGQDFANKVSRFEYMTHSNNGHSNSTQQQHSSKELERTTSPTRLVCYVCCQT